MRAWGVLAGGVALLVQTSICQIPPGGAPPQIEKKWELGQRASLDLEHRDGRIRDPAIIAYLQRLENTIASAAGAGAAEVRLTRSSDRYASRLPAGVLYISGGLLERIESEAELAGLLAHDLAHGNSQHGYVLASPLAPQTPDARELEGRATAAATGYLRAAGYDPAGVLDLLSKLASEQPRWATAILPEDLLQLRIVTEAEAVPPEGYRIDSSQFQQAHAALKMALERSPNRTRGAVLRQVPLRSR